MTHRNLLDLPPYRIQEELRRVRLADAADRVYVRRRNKYVFVGIVVWLLGFVIGGGAFATTSMEVASVCLLLAPLVSGLGPVVVLYVFWVRAGER